MMRAQHDPGTYEVVFKAGYEVVANDADEALELAVKELIDELHRRGVSLFVHDVRGRRPENPKLRGRETG